MRLNFLVSPIWKRHSHSGNRFSHPIVILGPALPEERSIIAERGFIPTISALEEAEDFDRVGTARP